MLFTLMGRSDAGVVPPATVTSIVAVYMKYALCWSTFRNSSVYDGWR